MTDSERLIDKSPLWFINRFFHVEFMNPRIKVVQHNRGQRYIMAVELDEELYKAFSELGQGLHGMILTGALKVAHSHSAIGICNDAGQVEELFEQPAPEKPVTMAQTLYKEGYFNNPELWAVLERERVYTPAMHSKLIHDQPCLCTSVRKNDTFHMAIRCPAKACGGEVEWHHVRTSATAGTATKPHDFYTVPLCQVHHELAHQKQTRELTDYLLKQAAYFRSMGIAEAMKKELALTSMNELTETLLKQWHDLIGFHPHE